jgi:putative ABC transport system permease protein
MSSLKQALRTLARTPGFTTTAVLSVAVAIGLAGSVFTIVIAAFFTKLPYPEADRLLELWQTERPGVSTPQDYLQPSRMLAFADAEPRHLESITGTGMGPTMIMTRGNESVSVDVAPIVGDWFATMGVRAARGRVLTPADERSGAERAAVVSARFAEEHSVDLGSTLDLSDAVYTVVGVMPDRFDSSARVWVTRESLPGELSPAAYAGVARLRDGATVEQGTQEIEQMAAAQVAADSARFGRVGATARPYGAMARGPNRPKLWLLAGIVLAVILIGISNLTQLFLVRAQRRGRGLAVRAAIGGTVWEIGSGLAAEGAIVGAAGGLLGLALTVWGKDAVRAFLGGEYAFPSAPRVGWPVAAFALSLAVLVSLMVGLEPLRRLGSLDLQGLLQRRAAGAATTPGERRSQRIMVAVQVAMCVVLVATAAVLGSAYRALTKLDMGYDADQVVEAMPDYAMARMDVPAQWNLARDVAARLRSNPAVSGAAVWQELGEDYPPRPNYDAVPDGPARALDRYAKLGEYYLVDAGSLEAMGIDLVAGRTLGDGDRSENSPVGVANRSAVEAWWPGESPLGHQIELGREGPWITIVGVVDDVQPFNELGRAIAMQDRHLPLLFIPSTQLPTPPVGWREFGCCDGVMIAVRPSTSTAAAAQALRNELAAAAPDLPIQSLGTMQSLQVANGYSGRSILLTGRLVAGGVLVALALALLGILGVARESLARRTRELGLRIALGARLWQIVGVAARESVTTALIGVALGLAVIFPLNAGLSSLVFGYDVRRLTRGVLDPFVLGIAASVVVIVACAAAIAAAAKAVGIDPAEALRSE